MQLKNILQKNKSGKNIKTVLGVGSVGSSGKNMPESLKNVINDFQSGNAEFKDLSSELKNSFPRANGVFLEDLADRARGIREGGESVMDFISSNIMDL